MTAFIPFFVTSLLQLVKSEFPNLKADFKRHYVALSKLNIMLHKRLFKKIEFLHFIALWMSLTFAFASFEASCEYKCGAPVKRSST